VRATLETVGKSRAQCWLEACNALRRKRGRRLKKDELDANLTAAATQGVHISTQNRQQLSEAFDAKAKSVQGTFSKLQTVGDWGRLPKAWSSRSNVNQPNYFYWNYLAFSGSIDSPWMKDKLEAINFGGSSADSMLALKAYDIEYKSQRVISNRKIREFMSQNGLSEKCAIPLHPDFFTDEVTVKGDANPGPSFIRSGIKRKCDAVGVAMQWLRQVLKGEKSVNSLPDILWGLAGRGKPTNVSKVLEKISVGKSVGRGVWMADTHESVFCWRYQQPLTQFFTYVDVGIDIGENKWSDATKKRMDEFLSPLGYFISGDWETWDAKVPENLIRMAFVVIRSMLGVEQNTIDDEILAYLEKHFVYSKVVCPDGVIRMKLGGVPSGSGLTTIVNCIVNKFVCWEINSRLDQENSEEDRCTGIRVMGDDNLQRFSCTGSVSTRFRLAKRRVANFSKLALSWYGMILHPVKSSVSVDPFVKFQVPKIYEKVPDHSRRYLKEHETFIVDKDTGHLRPTEGYEQYRVVRDSAQVDYCRENFSKRWNYMFAGTVKYLSTHFLPGGEPIRPKPELMTRLSSTPCSVKTIFQWRGLIMTYMLEWWNNLHARAELMSMYLDSFYMERHGIDTWQAALDQIIKLETGQERSPVRTILDNYTIPRPERNNRQCRQWWLTQADWWPVVTDNRFTWLDTERKALFEMMGRLRVAGPDLSLSEVGRLQSFLTFNRGLNQIVAPKSWKRNIHPFLHLWELAAGHTFSVEQPRKVVWTYSPLLSHVGDWIIREISQNQVGNNQPLNHNWTSQVCSIWGTVSFIWPSGEVGERLVKLECAL